MHYKEKKKTKTSPPFPKIVITHLIANNETLLETKMKALKINADYLFFSFLFSYNKNELRF